MIELRNVSALTPGLLHRQPIVWDASVRFESRERVGILAMPGSGKSTLARLLAGIDQPDRGTVLSEGRVSWPIGFAGFLHPEISVRANLETFARLVGMTPRAVTTFCEDFVGIDGLPGMVMKQLTPTQRAILAYACALAVPGPATWIADEVISVGENQHRQRCNEVLTERLTEGGLIFLSRSPRLLRAWCDRFLVLIDRRLIPCEDVDVAQGALELDARDRNAMGRGAA
ncbi:ATP-binding cassette domain-containing protein [Maliponia aquimaris]|uniref:Polysialic acid transport ATP-binding protein KpsT n=1 Tax=Maliponia aquimaris TaxID=1673631 RepID=A0A238K312_9RHOB|nr:ATP-binding cassette domain-containing protein [Maliponia aquimaris]SMX36502.1 Polysialic acid transport ATP-binding protein KpsT [Maliponia aquimaris]